MLVIACAALFISSLAYADDKITVFAFGDSLTAGYGLPPGEGFTAQLEAKLQEKHQNIQVINAGVSGDTTSGGKSRLAWVIDSLVKQPDIAILELGANDGLRAIDPDITRKNLAWIIEAFQSRNIPILLTGMLAPPNLGSDYGNQFNAVFPELAKEYDVDFYPFFLEGVAADPGLNQADGIHPNAQGVSIIVERITPYVLDTLNGKNID